MKTTLDLPDELMREVKFRALHERNELKDTIADLLPKGMASGEKSQPIRLRGGSIPRTEDIEAAIAEGRD